MVPGQGGMVPYLPVYKSHRSISRTPRAGATGTAMAVPVFEEKKKKKKKKGKKRRSVAESNLKTRMAWGRV